MARVFRRQLSRSAMAAYLSIGAALLVLLALATWGAYRDMQFLRQTLLESEIGRLRSHAERTAGRIERDLEVRGASGLGELDQDGWLRRHWQRFLPQQPRGHYAAVVAVDGEVMLHSDPSRCGLRLPRNWYDHVLSEAGEDVVETRCAALGGGQPAYDVRVAIEADAREVGEYHAGFDIGWFEQWMDKKQASFLRRRSILVGGVLLVVLLATSSLYFIASHSISLRKAIDSASLERASEVGKLAAGLAHEIRNPLHAIRLNLHSFRRAHQQHAELEPGEMTKMLEQSTREIDRIEHLMRQLVGFATPDEPRNEVIDLKAEIEAVVEFIRQQMLDKTIEIETRLPAGPVWARMDQGRLRQVMLNLLQNAQQAMEDRGGRIEVELSRQRGHVEIAVADNGPGMSEEDRRRVFEPFFSTKAEGTGLGLPLVKRFVDEVGGQIRCEANGRPGATFRIRLHAASQP